MLMLSTFLRVHEVSALVLDHATDGRATHRRCTARATLMPPHAMLARAPVPPEPADAHPAPHRRHLAPPPPARAAPPLPLFRAAARAPPSLTLAAA